MRAFTCRPIEIQEAGDQNRAQNDDRDPGYFDDGNPSWVKCHGDFLWHPSDGFDLDHAVRCEREEEWA